MPELRSDEMKRIASDLFAVWCSGEIKTAAPLVTSDFILCDHAFDRRHQGLESVESFFAETQDIIRLEFYPSEILADEGLGIASVTWTLTATIRKSDVRVNAPGMSSLRFRDGLVCEENDHYAATDVLKTLLRYHPIRTLMMAKKDLLS